MVVFSVKFYQALHHTLVLLAAGSVVIFSWAYLHLPQANLLIVVFAFLAAVRISELASLKIRTQVLAGMVLAAAFLQYTVNATYHVHFLNTVLPAAASWFILRILPPASAYPVLLTGFQAYTAEPGAYAAAQRSIDILLAGVVAWFITLPFTGRTAPDQSENIGKPLAKREAFLESFTLLCATILYKFSAMPQGIWIVLTTIFIYIARQPGTPDNKLVRQRIFSVPAGILLGGIYSGSVVMLDYRLAYLAPLIGAVGFFMLYYRHDFFSFSLFFMIAFTICADWMTGSFREFNFLQLLFARTLATLIGAALLLFIEKSAADFYGEAAA